MRVTLAVHGLLTFWYKELSYDEIPHMPKPSVEGHHGKLVYGQVEGRTVLCLAGRIHCYEGYLMHQLSFAIRVMAVVGVKTVLLSNAAGGAGVGMQPGSILVITDHLNLLRRSVVDGGNFYT